MALQYQTIIDQLTLEEKASLLSGKNFWNTIAIDRLSIPSMMLTDGPHGLRKQGGKSDHLGLNMSIPATCFPTAATLACSWDPSLAHRVGAAIGHEAAAQRVGVLLGPGLNIVRNPLGGRTFEYFSEDPLVAGKMAAGMVQGIQSTGVAACPKHFAVNSQEHLRMSIDEIVDDRALHEIYLEGFRYAVTEGRPRVVMSSYNKVNGEFANENQTLLHDILYGEWQFPGIVVTDWGGSHDRVRGLVAGSNLEMPSTNGVTNQEIIDAVHRGEVTERLVDERVDKVLDVILTAKKNLQKPTTVDFDAQHQQAIDAARQSLVLLKNDMSLLPLAPTTRVAVIGDFAETPRYQGAGSSLINPTKVEDSLEALRRSSLDVLGYAPGFKRFGGKSRHRMNEAVRLAKQADVLLLFLGLDEGSEAEGYDRATMRLPENQRTLVAELAKLGKKIVVIVAGGGPIELPFEADVSAIIASHLAGQGGGVAIAECITGKLNPSGKLAVSWPLRYSDVPSAKYFPGEETTAEHRESLYVGYRYYDTVKQPVRYPFGFGLSYTRFDYDHMKVAKNAVSVVVKNSGITAGDEIIQVYVCPHNAPVFRPLQELKGFKKVHLAAGSSAEVTIPLDDHSFAFYDPRVKKWVTARGNYTIAVGASSRDIRQTVEYTTAGETITKMDAPDIYWRGEIASAKGDDFAQLLGRHLPSARWNRRKQLTIEDTFRQLSYGGNWCGRLFLRGLLGVRHLLLLIKKPLIANNVMFIVDMPFYKMSRFYSERFSKQRVERMVRRLSKRR